MASDVRAGPNRVTGTSRHPFLVEEPRHVLRDLAKARLKRVQANLREHVTHVLDQYEFGLITRGLKILK
jgi:hypothetical protein